MWSKFKGLCNNRGSVFLENLLAILLVVLVIAISVTDLSQAISNHIIAIVERVNQIGTP